MKKTKTIRGRNNNVTQSNEVEDKNSFINSDNSENMNTSYNKEPLEINTKVVDRDGKRNKR